MNRKGWYIAGLIGVVLIAGVLVWYFFIREEEEWADLPCFTGIKEPKWIAFKNYVRGVIEDSDDEEWKQWTRAVLNKGPERPPNERSHLCGIARQHAWLNEWEEKRARKGLRPDGSKMKKGEEWSYQGPLSCLQGFGWDRYRFIKNAWKELAAGVGMKENPNSTTPEKSAEGAEWLWMTAGDVEWAKSFGSDTHEVETLCNQLKGLSSDGKESWYPDLIGHTEGVDDIKSLNLPKSMGGGPPGSYEAFDGMNYPG